MKFACAGLSADAVSERELNTSCLTFRDMQPPEPADSSSILQKARETPSRKRKSPFKNQKDDTLRFQDRVAQLITRNILHQSKRKFPFNTQKDDVSRFQDRMTHFEAQITSARTTEAASKALTSRQTPRHPEPRGPNDSVSLQEKARNRRQFPSFVDSVFKDSIISYEETIYRVVHFLFQDCTMSYEEKIARLRGHATENIRYSKAKKAEKRIAKLRAYVMENVQYIKANKAEGESPSSRNKPTHSVQGGYFHVEQPEMDPSALYAALESAIPTLEPERQSRFGSYNPGREQGTAEEERPEPLHSPSPKYIAEYDSRDAETAAEDITDTLIFLEPLPITIPGRFMKKKAQGRSGECGTSSMV